MGDTSSGALIAPFALDADVLIHESMHTWIPELQNELELKVSSARELDDLMTKQGHSTADMAGRFAAEIRAKTLILTNFSARYSDYSRVPSDIKIMNRIVDRACKAASEVNDKQQALIKYREIGLEDCDIGNNPFKISKHLPILEETTEAFPTVSTEYNNNVDDSISHNISDGTGKTKGDPDGSVAPTMTVIAAYDAMVYKVKAPERKWPSIKVANKN